MRAFLDDTAFVHHQDAVAGKHRGQAMRDHDGGALAHQGGERGGDLRLTFGIK